MFPIGFMVMMGRRRRHRRRALEARLAQVEERLGDLEEKMSSG
jgi:BMFP domain-containing protein YqiC